MREDCENEAAQVESTPVGGHADEVAEQSPDIQPSRRGFLQRSVSATGLVLAGSSAALGATKKKKKKGGGDKSSDKASKTNPYAPYGQLYPGQNTRNFNEILVDETNHVQTLIGVIQSLGGTPRPEPTFQNITMPSLHDFLTTSVIFENTGVGAYQGAVTAISRPDVLAGAASIALVEALHSGFLNSLVNLPLVPGGVPLSTALSQQEVVNRVTPYLASLNGGTTPAFSTTPSGVQNDIAILNFALLLEYLERDFYTINVPKFAKG